MPFPKEWKMKPVPWMPGAVPDLKIWVRALASTSTYAERSWPGRDAVLRPLPGEEEASGPVSKPEKGNKRKRASISENPKPKARSTRKSRKNTISFLESVQRLRNEDEEEEEDGSVLVARAKKTTDVLQAAGSMVAVEAHREACSRSRAELRQYEADLQRATEERKALKLLLAESQLQSLKEKSLVQARKTEELEARLASELAKAEKTKADVDAFVAVYRADAEAAQSYIHARGFDLTEEITKAKEIKADAGALASDDDDDDDDDDDGDGSKNGSQSGEEPDGEKTAPVDNYGFSFFDLFM
uniref:Uncharacterized protein n=1 Tax=Nicotiana tabacum TaxID=4097 RepID=A0A1S3ZC50_TOBAC|nr:PREDICTED: uncharacterized protein LOC107785238 [Nicotiana tabacum]